VRAGGRGHRGVGTAVEKGGGTVRGMGEGACTASTGIRVGGGVGVLSEAEMTDEDVLDLWPSSRIGRGASSSVGHHGAGENGGGGIAASRGVGVTAIAGTGASKGRRRLLSWQEWQRMGGAGRGWW
jgi:hypothetical protein